MVTKELHKALYNTEATMQYAATYTTVASTVAVATVRHAAAYTLWHPQWWLQLHNMKQLYSMLQQTLYAIHSVSGNHTT